MEKAAPPAPLQRRPEISRSFVELHRRRRFAAAAAEVAHEFGRGGITASTLIRVAGSARNTFYDLFGNAEECLRFALADAYERLFEPVLGAGGDGDWLAETEAAISGFYAAVAADPLAAELFLIHSFGVELRPEDIGPNTGAAALERLLAGGRRAALARGCRPAPPLAEEYLAHAVLAAATHSLHRGETSTLPEFSRPITVIAGQIYLGQEMTSGEIEPAALEPAALLPRG